MGLWGCTGFTISLNFGILQYSPIFNLVIIRTTSYPHTWLKEPSKIGIGKMITKSVNFGGGKSLPRTTPSILFVDVLHAGVEIREMKNDMYRKRDSDMCPKINTAQSHCGKSMKAEKLINYLLLT